MSAEGQTATRKYFVFRRRVRNRWVYLTYYVDDGTLDSVFDETSNPLEAYAVSLQGGADEIKRIRSELKAKDYHHDKWIVAEAIAHITINTYE